ncbi:fimbrial protein [Pseudomonas [fluorescens] ATCC 17400]|jgi:type 1 fimbria pilin|uniref:fimbrial protein n=1 Tax=Pseudomonas TaxID=286 RepID=UPI000493AD81|nr:MULTISPECIES: fimbrial protein [Pseudomonas]NMZ25919.1 fimbrial protein [Pseudomonas proteolytica]QJI17262.1 fimbrial protein [Pseudomonas sp. ADAK21]QJI22575.1 fimbrial protein [Pseudomonas sp. ADAK20]
MKVNVLAGTIMAVALAATSVSVMAADKEQGKGVITFKGTIIDAPCSIAQESQFQTIEMGQIANATLKNGGKSSPTNFKIELLGCDTSTLKKATATFTGTPATNPDLFALRGEARGASLAIADQNGELIKMGSESTAQVLLDGGNFLSYSAYLQGDTTPGVGGAEGTSAEITPGEFETFANFKLAYQ